MQHGYLHSSIIYTNVYEIKTNTTINRITHPYSFGLIDKAEVIIFPNPIVDESVVRIKNTLNTYDPIIISDIKIYDLTGRMIKNYSGIDHFEYIIKTSGELNGLYLIEITDIKQENYGGKLFFNK